MHGPFEDRLTFDQPTFPLEGDLVVITGRESRIRRLNEHPIHGDLSGAVGVVVSRTDRHGVVEIPTGEQVFVWLADVEPVRGEG
jgi:hypothetical protein